MKIVRAKDGSAAKKFKQGEENTNIEVNVTYPSKLKFSKQDEQIIWETATGGTALHDTKKATGMPSGSKGYLHNYSTNTLYAVKRLDTKKHTIEITAEGQAKNKNHQF